MALSPDTTSEVCDSAQVQIRMETGAQTQKEKAKAFLTQPRTASKLGAISTDEVTCITSSPVCKEQQIKTKTVSSKKGNKHIHSRRQRSLAQDEAVHDSEIEEEQMSRDTDEKEQERLRELDKLYPIPEGWPRLHDKIFKRRALFFRKPTFTSVQSAMEHLQKLQDRMEIWSREVELEILSRRSSAIIASVMNSSRSPSLIEDAPSSRLTTDNVRKQLRFVSDSVLSGAVDDLPKSSSGRSSTVRTPRSSVPTTHSAATHSATTLRTCELSVQGIGAIAPAAEMTLIGLEDEIPHLGAEEVIDEVLVLLGRLETDRRDTQELYEKECRRLQWLQSKIDRLAGRRMFELPRAVQREHEACATDIAELKWHCSYRARQMSRVQSQVETAELMNSRLMEDIAFVQKHCPLVEEKLELERDAMKRIGEAQVQTTDMLNQTEEKLKRTENKSAEAHGKADMERAHIKRELEAVRDALREINTELDETKALHTSYSHQCNDLRKKLHENAQEKIVLLSKCENAKAAEKIQAAKVKEVQEMIIEAEFEHRKKADHNFQLTSQMERTRNQQSKEVADLEGDSKRRLAELRERESHCRQMSMEIEDTEQKLKDCAKQQVDDVKNVDRIKREMTTVETQLAVVDEEFDKIKVINTAVGIKLVGEEDKAQMLEDTLQGTSDSLRKRVKEETHARTVLQARISSDTTDLAKQQVEAKKKKAKVSKKAFVLEQLVVKVLADVNNLRKEHAERQKTIAELQGSIASLTERHQEMEISQTSFTQELEPQCGNLEKEILNSTKRLDYMAHRTDLISKKLADVAKSQKVMQKVITNTEEAIAELTADLEEITIQLTSGQKQQDNLKDSLTQVTQRLEDGGSKHVDYMEARREALAQLESDLKQSLRENKELAHEYRQKQQEHLKLKEQLLDDLEGRISLEASIKDHKQLSGLQLRLHHALVHYYHIRGLFNQNELMRFEEMSAENGQRVKSLQREMDQAIDTISCFLTDQLDGTAASMVHAAATATLLKDDAAVEVPL